MPDAAAAQATLVDGASGVPGASAGGALPGSVDDYGRSYSLDQTSTTGTGMGRVAGAALDGAAAAFGASPLGLNGQTRAGLQRFGVLPPDGGQGTLMQALDASVLDPLAAGLDLAARTGRAVLGAYQGGVAQAGEELGQPQLGRDLAALPEAFAGSPNELMSARSELVDGVSTLDGAATAANGTLTADQAANGVVRPLEGIFQGTPLAPPAPATTPLVAALDGGGTTVRLGQDGLGELSSGANVTGGVAKADAATGAGMGASSTAADAAASAAVSDQGGSTVRLDGNVLEAPGSIGRQGPVLHCQVHAGRTAAAPTLVGRT